MNANNNNVIDGSDVEHGFNYFDNNRNNVVSLSMRDYIDWNPSSNESTQTKADEND